jgi:hypothetical protein
VLYFYKNEKLKSTTDKHASMHLYPSVSICGRLDYRLLHHRERPGATESKSSQRRPKTKTMEIDGSLFQHNQMSCWMPICHAPIQPNSHHLLFLNIQKHHAKDFKDTGLPFLKYCLLPETDNLPALRLQMLSVKRIDDAYLASKKSGMFKHSMMAST